MALSGAYYTNVGSLWRLQLEWSATQNVSANTSTVTAKLYWMATSSSGRVSSSAVKDCGIRFDGGSWNTNSSAGIANLSGNQKKLIHTATKVVTHASDGTASISFGAYFDLNLSLGGTSYSRITLDQKTYELNTIPRASELTSSTSWTAGNSVYVTIARASASFTHNLTVKVNGVSIKTITGIGNSTMINFTESENVLIFKELAKDTINWNQVATFELTTKNGSTTVGTATYTGTVSSPSASVESGTGDFNIGDTLNIEITRASSLLTHTVRLYLGETLIMTKTGVTNGFAWKPSDSERTAMYNAVPNSNSITSRIEVDTYYSTVLVRATKYKKATAYVTNSNPIFLGSTVSYTDSNPVTLALTGDGTKIVQNSSIVQVTLPSSSKAGAFNGASMVNYVATLGGEQVTVPHGSGDLVFNFTKPINASTNQTLTIKAIDSRNNSTQLNSVVTMVPYTEPVLNASAKRKNGFDTVTVLSVNGSVSPLTVSGVQKNRVIEVKYRHKKVTESNPITWNVWTSFTYTTNGPNYKATSVNLELDNTASHNVEFLVRDSLTTKSHAVVVSSGKPIVFIDSDKKAVGIGKFPTGQNQLEIDGDMSVKGVNTPYVNIDISTDITSNTSNVGLRVGNENTSNIKMDGNEILANTAGVPSTLHLQSEGGSVVIGENSPDPAFVIENGFIRNEEYVFPSLSNGWSNFSTSGGYQRCCYYKDKNGVVHITGLVKGGTTANGTLLFTLPIGYRPSSQQIFIQPTSTSFGTTSTSVATPKQPPARIDVLANGQVLLQANADSVWTSLSSMTFRSE